MSPLLLILILILLFGGGGGYYAYGPYGGLGSEESSSSFCSCWLSPGACSGTATSPNFPAEFKLGPSPTTGKLSDDSAGRRGLCALGCFGLIERRIL